MDFASLLSDLRNFKKKKNKIKRLIIIFLINFVHYKIGDCLQAHNSRRSSHGTPAMTQDSSLQQDARAYAQLLAEREQGLEHATGISDGENLYWAFKGGSSVVDPTCSDVVDNW